MEKVGGLFRGIDGWWEGRNGATNVVAWRRRAMATMRSNMKMGVLILFGKKFHSN